MEYILLSQQLFLHLHTLKLYQHKSKQRIQFYIKEHIQLFILEHIQLFRPISLQELVLGLYHSRLKECTQFDILPHNNLKLFFILEL